MKPGLRLLLRCALPLLGAVTAQAQIMPDSTVQVCAYWQAGDRYDFDYNESKYTVRAGDTTRIHTLYERRTIEVVSATRDTYLLEITYGDYRHSDPEAQRIHDLCLRTAGQLPPLRVETDQTGSFRRIVNLDEWSDLMRRIVRPVSDMLWEESSEEVRKALPRGKFRKLMERQLADPETLGRSCREELGRLLYFHGVRFPIVEEMAGEEAFLPLTGGEAIQAQTRFWLDEELSDEEVGVLRAYSSIDGREFLRAGLASLLRAAGFDEELPEELPKEAEGKYEIFTCDVIHFATGWTTYAEWNVYATFGPEAAAVERSLEMVLPEEE